MPSARRARALLIAVFVLGAPALALGGSAFLPGHEDAAVRLLLPNTDEDLVLDGRSLERFTVGPGCEIHLSFAAVADDGGITATLSPSDPGRGSFRFRWTPRRPPQLGDALEALVRSNDPGDFFEGRCQVFDETWTDEVDRTGSVDVVTEDAAPSGGGTRWMVLLVGLLGLIAAIGFCVLVRRRVGALLARLSPRVDAATERIHRLLFDHVAGAVLPAVACFGLYAAFALGRTFLHDEGLFTYDLAGAFWHSPAATLFFLKAKPVLVLLYAPVVWLGLTPYLLLHAGLAAAATLLVRQTARRLGVAHPNTAGWIMALSLGFAVAASNGFANADGAFFLALFLFLYFSGRHAWGGAVLGLLPFVRYELALVWLGFLLWDLWTRRDLRFVLASLAFPFAYMAAGALYHRDLLWLLSVFPNSQGIPAAIGFETPSPRVMGALFHRTVLINLGVLALPALFAVDLRDRRRTFLLGLTWLFFLLTTLFQMGRIFGFDASLRYHVAFLPLLALLGAYALAAAGRAAWIGAGCLSVLVLAVAEHGRMAMAVAAVLAATRLAARATGRDLIRPTNLALWAAGVGLLVSGLLGGYGGDQHRGAQEVMTQLTMDTRYHGQPLYTDLSIARFERCAGIEEVHLLANAAILWEGSRFANHDNGQFEALVRALRAGRIHLDPGAHAVQRDAIYLVKDGPRMDRWRRHLEAERPRTFQVGGYRAFHWPPE